MLISKLSPAEETLSFRVRRCFPARLRDEILPSSDELLVDRICMAQNSTRLTAIEAYLWVIEQLRSLATGDGEPSYNENNLPEENEIKLMSARINEAFAAVVQSLK